MVCSTGTTSLLNISLRSAISSLRDCCAPTADSVLFGSNSRTTSRMSSSAASVSRVVRCGVSLAASIRSLLGLGYPTALEGTTVPLSEAQEHAPLPCLYLHLQFYLILCLRGQPPRRSR